MVVFIHGLFPAIYDTPPGWLLPDLPGYGANPIHPATLPAAVEYLRGVITEPTHLVGHSIGGAIALLFAAFHPDRVASVINVEGNFTLKDAFWSSCLAAMTEAEAEAEIAALRANPGGWLAGAQVPVTTGTLATAERSLATSAHTIQSMARSVVDITARPEYLDQVQAVLDREIPIHLIAGELSRNAWDVPDFVVARSASFQVQPNAGHMLMMNDLPAFATLVAKALA
jgi:pimeloyl-ACP methyl ester carboxylesterase